MKKIHDFDQVFDSQKLYRILLEAFSNPGRCLSIRESAKKMYGEESEFLALGMTLLDNEVGFHTCGDEELAQQLVSLTLSREEGADEADYVFVRDASVLPEVIGQVKCGTLKDPQKSATLFIRVDGTGSGARSAADAGDMDSGDAGRETLCLCGPGIRDTLSLTVPTAVIHALSLRDAQYYEYPQGIDLVFVTDEGELFALPRLVKKEVG